MRQLQAGCLQVRPGLGQFAFQTYQFVGRDQLALEQALRRRQVVLALAHIGFAARQLCRAFILGQR